MNSCYILFLQVAHSALLEELALTSSRNAYLEQFYKQYSTQMTELTNELRQCKAQNEMLLVMLGEKSEELESTIQDIKDVKELYRSQLDIALNAIVVQQNNGNGIVSIN